MAAAPCGHRQAMSQCSSTGHPAASGEAKAYSILLSRSRPSSPASTRCSCVGQRIAELAQDRPCPGHAFPGHQDVEVSGDAEAGVAVERLGQRHSLQRDDGHPRAAQAVEHPTERARDERVPRGIDPTRGLEGRSAPARHVGPAERLEASGDEGHDAMRLGSIEETRPGDVADEPARAILEIRGRPPRARIRSNRSVVGHRASRPGSPKARSSASRIAGRPLEPVRDPSATTGTRATSDR